MTSPITGSDPCGNVRWSQPADASRPRQVKGGGGQPPLPPMPPVPRDGVDEPASAASSGQLRQLARTQAPPQLDDPARLERGRQHLEQGWFHTREGVDAVAEKLVGAL